MQIQYIATYPYRELSFIRKEPSTCSHICQGFSAVPGNTELHKHEKKKNPFWSAQRPGTTKIIELRNLAEWQPSAPWFLRGVAYINFFLMCAWGCEREISSELLPWTSSPWNPSQHLMSIVNTPTSSASTRRRERLDFKFLYEREMVFPRVFPPQPSQLVFCSVLCWLFASFFLHKYFPGNIWARCCPPASLPFFCLNLYFNSQNNFVHLFSHFTKSIAKKHSNC